VNRILVALAAIVGIALRLWVWWHSIGSNDVLIFAEHAQRVGANGLVHTYETHLPFNHPPLMGLWAAEAWKWSGGDTLAFARLLKVPGLGGEALALWSLWRFAGPIPFAVYATAPAAILVSAFHGNTDALCSALLALGCLAFDRGRFFGSGLLWGAALNVKLLPLPLLPLILIAPRDRRAWVRVFAGLAVAALPFLPVALLSPGGLQRNILQYAPNTDNWGFMAFINASAALPDVGAAGAAAVRQWYAQTGRLLLLVSIGIVAFKTRGRWPLTTQAAVGAAIFLFLAPGFGVQYVIYALPLLCFVHVRAALWWGWLSGIFILAAYLAYRVSWSPMQSVFTDWMKGPAPLLGLLAWVVLALFLRCQFRRGLTAP
jgi:hypothetical protein